MTARSTIHALGSLILASTFAAAAAVAQSFEVVHSFVPDEGSDPQAGIVQLPNGDFAGTTVGGIGTLFRMDARGVLNTVYRFKGIDGANPHSPLLLGSDGAFYGTAMNGAAGWGDVYRFDPSGDLTVLKSFVPSMGGSDGEGATPHAPLILLQSGTQSGVLYGVTTRGGKDDLGTIFRMDQEHKLVTVRHFSGWDGALPFESLLEFGGHLYGTTTEGGLAGGGVIFRIDVDGSGFTVLHNFVASEGIRPEAPLVAADGVLYGTTSLGGRYGMGTAFRLDPRTALVAALHHFTSAEGANPHAALVLARDGYLYGTTFSRGGIGDDRGAFGSVFRMRSIGTSSPTFEVIHRFNGMDGAFSQSRMIEATDGALYGTTTEGGSHNLGVVFRIVNVPVASIQPSSGPAAGGRKIEITGSNFQPGLSLTFGGHAAELVESTETTLAALPPSLVPGMLYDVFVDNADRTRGGVLKGYLADFLDVPQEDAFHGYVEKAVRRRITAGRGDGTFGRNLPATHGQMAVFLLRAKHGPFFTPGPATGLIFLDVPKTHRFAAWIEQLRNEGLTDGWKGGALFFPDAPTTRAEMAGMILKAEHGAAYAPPPCEGLFEDVPCSDDAAPWIEQMFEEGITGGCRVRPALFCPMDLATRGQTSVFLTKAFDLN